MAKLEVKVPDLGDFKDVEIVEVLVKAGDTVRKEQSLIVLETDKAAMEVPAPAAGTLSEIKVSQGGRVSTGDLIALMEVAETAGAPVGAPSGATPEPATPPVGAPSGATTTTAGAASAATDLAAADGASVAKRSEATGVAPEGAPTKDIPPYEGKVDQETELLVLGAGPGGYTAAFRAADLGLKVTLVERWPTLGGVCLNVGCIPSKALLHAAKVIEEAESFRELGLDFGQPKIDAGKLKAWKDKVVGRLTGGLVQLAKQRKVTVVRGTGRFVSPHHVAVENEGRTTVIGFRQCIIAAGSESARIPGLPDDPRVIDSTGALELDLPKSLLVVGGGIIGLEMATVYDALGVKVSVVELLDQLMPGVDPDLLRPLEKRIRKRYADVRTGTKVAAMKAGKAGIEVSFEKDGKTDTATYDRVLVAVGRTPNGGKLDAGKAGVNVSERGFIPVDKQQRTNVPHIFAIGDIVGQPMLAHKATHEGKVAAEVAAGHKRYFDARVIPSVAYTDPEVAWVGLTEAQAKAGGIAFEKGSFPWAASGRSLALNRDEGLTKLLFDPATKRVLGAGIVGPNAGDLISEVALAIELGADAEDIGLTVHPHPTLSETVAFAAEAFDGTLTDLYLPRKK